MSDELPTPTATSPRPRSTLSAKPGWRTAAILGAIAFLAGLAAMAIGLRMFPQWFAAAPVATVTLPIASTAGGDRTPVVIVPGSSGPAAPAIDLDALSARETELAARLADLEARTASVGGQARAASGYATRAEGLMIAFAARRQIDRGLPLGYLEEQLRGRFGPIQPQAVGTIVQAAQQPVTIEDLRVGLDAIAPELRTGVASEGWVASLGRELGNLIVLHRADTPSPLPADRLARARRTLEAGHVEAALAEVARMPGAARAEGWTSAARRYIGARNALDTIETAAIMGQGAPGR